MTRALIAAAAATVACTGSAATPPRQILFVGYAPGGGELALLLLDLRDDSVRTVVGAPPGSPQWSPDGTRIVYDTGSGLAVVAAAGGSPRTITSGEDVARGWSRDGRWIAFARYPGGKPQEVWIVRPDGSQLRRLRVGSVADAAWAADSRHVLVTGSRGIELVGLDGRTEPLPHARHGAEAAVSPDGRWIAFAAYENLPYAFGIAVEHADGTGFRLLTHGSRSHSDDNPAWSPTGRTIAFTRGYYGLPQEYSGIVTVGLEGRHVRPLEDQFTAHDERPRWSPDGRTIVFDRDAAVEPIGEAVRLGVIDVASRQARIPYDGYIDRWTQSWRPR